MPPNNALGFDLFPCNRNFTSPEYLATIGVIYAPVELLSGVAASRCSAKYHRNTALWANRGALTSSCYRRVRTALTCSCTRKKLGQVCSHLLHIVCRLDSNVQ